MGDTDETMTKAKRAAEFQAMLDSRRSKKLHSLVEKRLVAALGELFPEWVAIPEAAQTPGGRNDLIFFRGNGRSICFELFATKTQVDRDLLLLYEASAEKKVAILLDREADASIAEVYYRKRPRRPFPIVWASDVLHDDRRRVLHAKLIDAVLDDGWARTREVLRQLSASSFARMLRQWRADGIDIIVDTASATLKGVYLLALTRRLQALGCNEGTMRPAVQRVSENFDFVLQQTLYGVPAILYVSARGASIIDHNDHELIVSASLYEEDADHTFVLLNPIYDEVSGLRTEPLPSRPHIRHFMDLIRNARRSMEAGQIETPAARREG